VFGDAERGDPQVRRLVQRYRQSVHREVVAFVLKLGNVSAAIPSIGADQQVVVPCDAFG
jgi:hypothetical protein